MNSISQENAIDAKQHQSQQKLSVDVQLLPNITESEEKEIQSHSNSNTIPSIPTTPEDPSPSTVVTWPSSSLSFTQAVENSTSITCDSSHSNNVHHDEVYPSTSTMMPGIPMNSMNKDNFDRLNASNDVDMIDSNKDSKTSPISINSSRSGSTTSDDDDFLQASVNTVIAAPIMMNASRRQYSNSITSDTIRENHEILRPSISAGHLSGTNTTMTTAIPKTQQQPSQYSAVLLSQLSDSESVGSGESIQDLIGCATDASCHRQISNSAMGYLRGYPSITATNVFGSNPPPVTASNVRPSHFGASQHSVPHQHVASTSAFIRTMSQTALAGLDEDIASTSRPTYDLPYHQHAHGTAKHLYTEQVVSKHTLKSKLNKFQNSLNRAFQLIIHIGTEESIIEGCGIVTKVMVNAWVAPKIGHDLAYGLCDYLRETGFLELLIRFLLNPETKHRVRLAAGRALEECLSAPNRDYITSKSSPDGSDLERFVEVIKSFKEGEELRIALSLLESLFKQSAQTNAKLIELSALDFVLNACKATTNQQTLRHAALACANLSMYSDNECQQRMIAKNVPDWLFLLASSQDDITRYYACLAICVLVSNKEIEAAVVKSGTLDLVEPFLLARKPADFATSDYKHCQGRPMQWLAKLVPVLNAKRRESRAMAAFHFAMEAGIKKDQEALGVFEQIGAVEPLKQVAALPEEVAPKFASMALEIIGEEVPYKLSHQVPLWSVEDVQYWVTHIGFEKYSPSFYEQKVDGDLLLLISDQELADDIGMKSGLLRKRFMRELESLKVAADYSCVDASQLDRFLVSVNPHFSVYTYRFLEMGVDRSVLFSMTDEMMKSDCGVGNPVHRSQLMQSLQDYKHIDDMEVALLSKHIDIFISYRRSTGNQLASLIKVLLQLRGYKVFIDVDRLYAGKFDSSLLKNIQAAKHFVLVLTPHALDRCVDDDECQDWVHKEVLCALQHQKNIIPVFDPQFEWPESHLLPQDIRGVTRFNGVRWVHEYQEACVDKLEKFIEGEINIDRGYNASPQRNQQQQHGMNYRNTSSKPNSVNNSQLINAPEAADLVLEALTATSRGRASSHDQLLS